MRSRDLPVTLSNTLIHFSFIFSEFDAFVSNQSTIFITEPDLWSDPSEVISYEIDKTNTEIEATCTAYGGNPEPKFHW